MLIVGYSKAGVATLTPLLFAQIGFGTLLGWLVFDHVPDAQALRASRSSGRAARRAPG
jgi:drug/metabolite transporter (DMT)-like permease